MENPEYRLRRETEAARQLLSELFEELDGDHQLVTDMVEGETGLLEAIDLALSEMDEAEALVIGLKDKEAQFLKRRRLLEGRIDRLRALIEQAMASTEQTTLRRATATLTLRRLPPQVVVTAEPDIPSEFFVPQPPPPPKLDLKRLRQALLDRAARLDSVMAIPDPAAREQALLALPSIPGAVLNNGGQSLQVRRA